MNTHEAYIIRQIARLETELKELADKREAQDKGLDYWFSHTDYTAIFNRKAGQRDILYMILTGHDNPNILYAP